MQVQGARKSGCITFCLQVSSSLESWSYCCHLSIKTPLSAFALVLGRFSGAVLGERHPWKSFIISSDCTVAVSGMSVHRGPDVY